MKKRTQAKLLTSLTSAIGRWEMNMNDIVLEEADSMPWLSEKTFESMALAAMTVLIAIADAQKTALRDGYLKEGK